MHIARAPCVLACTVAAAASLHHQVSHACFNLRTYSTALFPLNIKCEFLLAPAVCCQLSPQVHFLHQDHPLVACFAEKLNSGPEVQPPHLRSTSRSMFLLLCRRHGQYQRSNPTTLPIPSPFTKKLPASSIILSPSPLIIPASFLLSIYGTSMLPI